MNEVFQFIVSLLGKKHVKFISCQLSNKYRTNRFVLKCFIVVWISLLRAYSISLVSFEICNFSNTFYGLSCGLRRIITVLCLVFVPSTSRLLLDGSLSLKRKPKQKLQNIIMVFKSQTGI